MLSRLYQMDIKIEFKIKFCYSIEELIDFLEFELISIEKNNKKKIWIKENENKVIEII
jgi:hypothetical protein